MEFRNALPKHWIFRETISDYGIDCEVEIVLDDGTVTGAILKAQVKGNTTSIDVQKGGTSVSIERVRYWIALPVPTIIVRVTENPNEIRWIYVRQCLQEKGKLASLYATKRKSIYFNFREANIFSETIPELEKLAFEHQFNVSNMQTDIDVDAGAHFIGYVILIGMFNGDPDAMIQWLREKASLTQAVEDLPFAVWVKEQAERNPEFINRVHEMVDEMTNFDVTALHDIAAIED